MLVAKMTVYKMTMNKMIANTKAGEENDCC